MKKNKIKIYKFLQKISSLQTYIPFFQDSANVFFRLSSVFFLKKIHLKHGKKIGHFFLFLFCFCVVNVINIVCYAIDEMQPSYEDKFGMWYVFTIQQNDMQVCYAVSNPIGLEGNYREDRRPYIMVALFNGTIKQEVSIVSGYFYKANSVVSISIDGQQERFIAEDDAIAWPERLGNDKKIIAKMINGSKMLVFSEEYSGLYSVDTYSLNGFTKAYKKAQELCSR